MLGAFTTALGDDEIIEAIDVPKLSRAGRYGYYKFCRKTGEFAEASRGGGVRPDSRTRTGLPRRAARRARCRCDALAQRGRARSGRAAQRKAVAAALAQAAPDLDAVEQRMAGAAVMRALEQAFRS